MMMISRQLQALRHRITQRILGGRTRQEPPPALPYDAWLMFDLADVCNLRCSYCISDSPGFPAPKVNEGKVPLIQIERVVQTLDATSLTFKIVFAGGGEPLLIPNLVDTCVALTQKHYVALHTNLTFPRVVRDFVARVDPHRVFYIVASFHADELERTGMTERFIDSVKRLRKGGFPVTVSVVAHPDILPRIPQIEEQFRPHGIEVSYDPFVGTHKGRAYPEAYSEHVLQQFELGDPSIYRTAGRLCNAGTNVAMVLANGDVQTCTEVDTKIGNIYDRIEFRDQLITCPSECCRCPFYAHDTALFEQARFRVGRK
jgi:MoaA/NifB/PqqE/SkfB family radical SAM enzyme